jgi:hypothetical protein
MTAKTHPLMEALLVLGAGLLLGLLILQPAMAWAGDCTPPCPMNGTLPTPGGYNGTATWDFENSTYTRYWFNYSSPLDFPWVGFIYSLTLPIVAQWGAWAFAVIWFVYLAMLYNRQEQPIGVFVIGILSATVMGGFFPRETYLVAILVFAVSAAGILVTVMKERH